ncbi:MAG: homoserine kinase [Beggiatoa sp. IS2]|nr:MAG: homoserine kinase [Beggiatoa sp. IS2]
MSVYTVVTRQQLKEFLSSYDLGNLVNYQGISAGIENTNYFVTTTAGEFVLTLFEQFNYDELPYFLELTAYLSEHAIPCAHPLADKEERYLRELNGKPSALVERLQGHDVNIPTLAQCQAIGTALGRLHVVSAGFPYRRPNGRGPHWWKLTAERLRSLLTAEDVDLLQEELHFQSKHRYLELPRGTIHADLFRDNALFEGDTLTGIIDFYYACDDAFLYDVAVTVNDWCSLPEGHLDETRMSALLDNYCHERKFTYLEQQVWSVMLRAAALRFWLSRLRDLHFPRPGEITHLKDPQVFRNILLAHKR